MNAPNRQPKGQSVGGQFAPTRNSESNVDLIESGTSIAVTTREGNRGLPSLYDFGNEFVVAHPLRGGWEADTAVTSSLRLKGQQPETYIGAGIKFS